MNDFTSLAKSQSYLGQRILAIDFGSKVIGTAIFYPGKDLFPYMHEKIISKDDETDCKKLTQIINSDQISVIVFGVPLFLDGNESLQTMKARIFGKKVKEANPHCLFFEQDETLSTKTAESRMKNSPLFNFKVDPKKLDCLSAVIILEDFLRS